VFRRQQHVASADQPGQPALSYQVADDLAGRRLGAEKPDDVGGVHDFAALLPEGEDHLAFFGTERA
jgi:hypothetical protein